MPRIEPLGEALVQRGVINKEQLRIALAEHSKTREPLGQILLRFHFVRDEATLKEIVAEQTKLPLLKLEDLRPKMDQRLKELIPRDVAYKHLILPLSREHRKLRLVLSRPPDVILLDTLRKMADCDIVPLLAMEQDVKDAIDKFYGSTELEEVVSSSEIDAASSLYIEEVGEQEIDLGSLREEADQAPVVKLVDLLLKRAVDDRASDIHIEPFANTISIRYRIDGVLFELPPPPRQFHLALVSRIKLLSKLDIVEKRIPQDGSFSIQYQARKIDIRVSSMPVLHGEKIVMRLLEKSPELLDVASLGLEPEQLKAFTDLIDRPYGLVFVTGPTGSGKTTTLYAALNKIRSPTVNVVTIEDPVEYQIEGINQVQVKPDIGLTFATALRSFLRQDPDVILVGEVRDEETAEICIRAALTGHLVLSTLHTNDAPTCITRLIDIGIKPFLVSSSLILIAAQRLVRQLCDHCKEPYKIDVVTRDQYHLSSDTVYRPVGCGKCRKIGYWGRKAVYEILPVDEEFRRLIAKGGDLTSIRERQKSLGLGTLLTSAMRKVEHGQTSIEEAVSAAYE